MDTHGIIACTTCRNDVESKEELDNLLEESSMPLQTLLARYNAPDKPDKESKITNAVATVTHGVFCVFYFLQKLQVHTMSSRDKE